MILIIKFSGGMGVSYQGSVDLSALPEDLLESVRKDFSEESLSKLSASEQNRLSADSVTYELQYGDSERKYSINEIQMSDESLELIDDLKPYLKLIPKVEKTE